MRAVIHHIVLLSAALLSACSATQPIRNCCYEGPTEVTRLEQLPVTLADGRERPFSEVFSGFSPNDAWFQPRLPFEEALAQDIIYQSLYPLLAIYDANHNGRLEEPEVVVLYAREAARGLGIDIAHFGRAPGVWAVDTANADIGALVRWVAARRGQMNPSGRQIFVELERLGLDIRTRGSDNGPRKVNGKFVD